MLYIVLYIFLNNGTCPDLIQSAYRNSGEGSLQKIIVISSDKRPYLPYYQEILPMDAEWKRLQDRTCRQDKRACMRPAARWSIVSIIMKVSDDT